MTSFLQQLLDPVASFLPAHMLLDGQALEGLNRSFRRVLRFQVGPEDVDIVIELLQILFFDRSDALQHFAGVEGGLGSGERVGGSGWGLAFDGGDAIGAHAEPFEGGSGKVEVDLIASMVDLGNLENGPGAALPDDPVADLGYDWRLGLGRFLTRLGHSSASVAERTSAAWFSSPGYRDRLAMSH
jgi:hypothetical protein